MTHDGSAEIRWFCCQSVKPFLLLLFVWMRTQFESGSEIFTVSYILYNVQCTLYSVAEPVRSLPGPTTPLPPQKVGFQLL